MVNIFSMMLREIAEFPTVIWGSNQKIHESCFRAFHKLVKVRELLQEGAPSKVVLDILTEMDQTPNKEQI